MRSLPFTLSVPDEVRRVMGEKPYAFDTANKHHTHNAIRVVIVFDEYSTNFDRSNS